MNDAFHIQGEGANGRTISVDAGPGIGGHDLGVRPVELLLMAVASCTSIDFKMIMNKQRQKMSRYEIDVDSTREGEHVKPFKTISLHFDIWGSNLDENKVTKAIELAMYKYCSVSESLDPNIKITYTFTLNEE